MRALGIATPGHDPAFAGRGMVGPFLWTPPREFGRNHPADPSILFLVFKGKRAFLRREITAALSLIPIGKDPETWTKRRRARWPAPPLSIWGNNPRDVKDDLTGIYPLDARRRKKVDLSQPIQGVSTPEGVQL